MYDAHVHLIDPGTFSYPWMEAAPSELHGRFWLEDLLHDTDDSGINGFILVQTHSSVSETLEYLNIAHSNETVSGVIGWLDLTSATISDDLAALQDGLGSDHMVGLRHQVEDESDPGWLIRPDVLSGLAALEGSGLVFDLLVRTEHLDAATEAVKRNPGLDFVVDHLAKPPTNDADMAIWEARLQLLSNYPNVYAKVSGLGSHAADGPRFSSRIQNVVEIALDAFGPQRLIFGSDWPIARVTDDYSGVLVKTRDSLRAFGLSASELADVFLHNTKRIYSLPLNDQKTERTPLAPERKNP